MTMRRRLGGALVACVALAVWATPARATHGYDKDCGDFASQAEAQHHMNSHPGDPDGLDGNDQDGRACESNACPCYYGSATAPEPTPSPAPVADPYDLPARRRVHRARILRVIDGDTLRVRMRGGARRTVRLIGIDAPESRKPGVPVECGARAATAHMKRLAFKRRRGGRAWAEVRLVTDATQDAVDAYGRILAYVERLPGRRDLGRAMVRRGWAAPYAHGNRPFRRQARYRHAHAQARKRDRGVFRRCAGDFHSKQ